MELQSGISLAYNRSRVGTRTRVLVDSVSDGVLVARSQTESPEVDGEILIGTGVRRPGGAEGSSSSGLVPGLERFFRAEEGPSGLIGHFLDVNIIGADEYDLLAEI